MDFRDITEFIKDTLKYIIVIIIVVIINIYMLGIETIIGESMKPTFNENEVVLINKLSTKLFDIKRGTIVSINDNNKRIIKRVIGIPGDNVKYKDNQLIINGNIISEPYLKNESTEDFELESISGELVIPKNKYLVLGDNRNNSIDSRQIGLINKKDIVGKVFIRFWPLKQIKIFK